MLRNSERVVSRYAHVPVPYAFSKRTHTIEVYAPVLVDVGFGDEIVQLRVTRIEAESFHDLAQLRGRDIALEKKDASG
jgi:hypothetical protein